MSRKAHNLEIGRSIRQSLPLMNGKFWKWVHFSFIFAFMVLWAVATWTGWIQSVTFVSHVSMVALVYAAASAWQAAKAEEGEEK